MESAHLYRLTGVLCVVMFAALPVTAEIRFPEYDRHQIDQLEDAVARAPRGDRGRLHSLLARALLDKDPAEANRHLALAGDTIAEDDLAGRGYIASTWCWSHLITGDMSQAADACERGVALADSSGNEWAIANAYGARMVLHYQIGELAEAYESGRAALDAAQRSGRTTQIAKHNNALGLVLRAQGMFQDGLDHFVHGLEMLEPELDEELYRILAFNIGLTYADLGQHGLARDFYASALDWTRRTERYGKELTALIYIGVADIALGEPQRTVESLQRTLERPEMLSNQGYLAFAYAVLGEAYLALEDVDAALTEYERGMSIALQFPNTFEQRRLKTGYARALLKSGDTESARRYLLEAIEQLRAENSRRMLLTALDLLVELEEAEGNYEASLRTLKETGEISRDFQRQTMEHQLALLRADFEFDEKERALAEAQQETIVRNGVIMLFIALAFIAYLVVSRRVQVQRADQEAAHALELETIVAERTAELRERITQANEAEKVRLALERQLGEAEKLRVLGQLTGGVAHDFNNLLTVVIGAAELLRGSFDEDDDARELVNHIVTAASSGADITRALMAYARKQPLQLETVELNRILADRIPLIERTLGGMVKITLDMSDVPTTYVSLDSAQLTTALLNLALNAKDAQGDQGEILVRLSLRAERWVVITVADSGTGMTPEQLARAAEPFYTTKRDNHGNGLGLSMVYGFSKQLGGDLEIESKLDVGTEVRIVLPRAEAAEAADVEQAGVA